MELYEGIPLSPPAEREEAREKKARRAKAAWEREGGKEGRKKGGREKEGEEKKLEWRAKCEQKSEREADWPRHMAR